MKRITLTIINAELKRRGHAERLVRGRGYFYFVDGQALDWFSSSVFVNHLHQLTLAEWIAARQHLSTATHQ
jgi:hypothetical protein